MITTHMRLRRLRKLLDSKHELTPIEWSIARDLMNRSYLSFRNYLELTSGMWLDAMVNLVGRQELADRLTTFYEIVAGATRNLEEHRKRIEERRVELTVIPLGEQYPPVKPPNYFGGDLMGVGPWSQFWSNIVARAHHFRETVG